MPLWLLAFKLDQPVLGQNRYALTVLNLNPDDFGLSRTPLADHSFASLGAVTNFVVTRCKPGEVDISQLEHLLSESQFFHMQVSEDSAIRMGFKIGSAG